MTWLYESKPIDENSLEPYVGFVYCITNTVDNKKYIGKKLLKFKKSKTIKGKKKKFLIESDWKTYWGSNKQLHLDIEELGEEAFKREILKLCTSKGDCNYTEAKFQFENSVLETEKYYNDAIMVRVHRSHLKKLDFSKNSIIIKVLQ
jgi:hypothetical protein